MKPAPKSIIITTQEIPQPQPWMLPAPSLDWYSSPRKLELLAQAYRPIGLKQMDSIALLNRVDTKFVLTAAQLLVVLAALQHDYQILVVEKQYLNHYRTLYYDTADFALYNLHVNDRAERYKVRSREYTDSSISFLEVKHKTRKDRTIKTRIPTQHVLTHLNHSAEDWLVGQMPTAGALEAKLWNSFTRITLVNTQCCERVTLDLDLTFSWGSQFTSLDGVVIAEVKRSASCAPSPFLSQMRALHIHPTSFSKYCLGVAMLYNQVKKNSLKPKMRFLEKSSRE